MRAVPVRIIQPGAQAAQPRLDLLRLEGPRAVIDPQPRERRPVHILHGNGSGVLVFQKIINANDIRMGQLQAAAGLPLEIIPRGRVHEQDFGEKLKRHGPVQLFILRQPDHTHPPTAEQLT